MDVCVHLCVYMFVCRCMYICICEYAYVCIRVSIFLFCLMHNSHLERGLDVSLFRSCLLRFIHGVPAGVRLFILLFNLLRVDIVPFPTCFQILESFCICFWIETSLNMPSVIVIRSRLNGSGQD